MKTCLARPRQEKRDAVHVLQSDIRTLQDGVHAQIGSVKCTWQQWQLVGFNVEQE